METPPLFHFQAGALESWENWLGRYNQIYIMLNPIPFQHPFNMIKTCRRVWMCGARDVWILLKPREFWWISLFQEFSTSWPIHLCHLFCPSESAPLNIFPDSRCQRLTLISGFNNTFDGFTLILLEILNRLKVLNTLTQLFSTEITMFKEIQRVNHPLNI